MKKMITKVYSWFGNDIFKVGLFFLMIFISVFFTYAFHPVIEGDSTSYVQAMEVMKTGIAPEDFTPHRILSTFLGLKSIMIINVLVGNLLTSWFILNSFLYIAMGMFFYSLLFKIFDISRTAFLGTLLLVTNYAAVNFSLRYIMDIGGWAFYVASLYFSYLYLRTRENKWFWIASVLIGLGGLFKEYAFLAYIVVLGLVIYINWKRWSKILKLVFLSGLLAFGPALIVNIYSFFVYHYTYLSWFLYAQSAYVYKSRLLEYLKSFGSLYNFGWFLFVGGFYLLLKNTKEIFKNEKILFIWLVIFSSLPAFVWPVVTRVLFITIPAVVMVTSLFIEKINKPWISVFPIMVLYVLSNYLMDAYILDAVDIERFFFIMVHSLLPIAI